MGLNITWADKDKTATLGTGPRTWRDVDANEVKNVVNNFRASLVDGLVPLSELPDAAKTILSATDFNAAGIANGFIVFWDQGTGKFRTKAEANVGTNLDIGGNTDVFLFDREVDGDEVTLLIGLEDQLAGTVLAAPENETGTPTFRRLGLADIDGLAQGAEIISSEVIITSDIDGTITANWRNATNQVFTVTDEALVFLGTPETGDFRWDLVELLSDGNVLVNSGDEGVSAVRPTPTAGALIAEEIIWNDAGEATTVPGPTATPWSILRFNTQLEPDTTGKFAKIWEGSMSRNEHYAIDILYNDPRNASSFAGAGTGRMKVSWTCSTSRDIISDTVKFFTDGDGIAAEFRLIQITGKKAAIYHKSSHYWSRIEFRIVFQSSSVKLNDFVSGSSYITAPAAIETFNSVVNGGAGTVTSVAVSGTDGIEVDSGSPITTSGTIVLGLNAETIRTTAYPEAIERANNTVLFDKDYITGNAGARTGNILFDFTGAKLGATTYMKHQDASAFTFPAQAVLLFDAADVSITVANFFCFMLVDKTASSEKVHVTLSQVGV